jgi:hypothetical protein
MSTGSLIAISIGLGYESATLQLMLTLSQQTKHAIYKPTPNQHTFKVCRYTAPSIQVHVSAKFRVEVLPGRVRKGQDGSCLHRSNS